MHVSPASAARRSTSTAPVQAELHRLDVDRAQRRPAQDRLEVGERCAPTRRGRRRRRSRACRVAASSRASRGSGCSSRAIGTPAREQAAAARAPCRGRRRRWRRAAARASGNVAWMRAQRAPTSSARSWPPTLTLSVRKPLPDGVVDERRRRPSIGPTGSVMSVSIVSTAGGIQSSTDCPAARRRASSSACSSPQRAAGARPVQRGGRRPRGVDAGSQRGERRLDGLAADRRERRALAEADRAVLQLDPHDHGPRRVHPAAGDGERHRQLVLDGHEVEAAATSAHQWRTNTRCTRGPRRATTS